MAEFLNDTFADFVQQLKFAPPDRRREQIAQAEALYWEIDPQRNYPIDFVVYRITRIRPETMPDETLTGEAVQHDLRVFVEVISESLEMGFDDFDPPPMDAPTLCRRLNVSSKTLQRYRRDGLFAWRLKGPRGRYKLGYFPRAVERFVAMRPEKVDQASRFSRIDDETRHAIITRARRISARAEVGPYTVARHLAGKFDRSPEAVRRLLLQHDEIDPRTAIFPDHTPPLTAKQQRVIVRAYRRGVSVARLAKRFHRSRHAIYRVINLDRAEALRRLDLRYVPSPTFALPDAEQILLGDGEATDGEGDRASPRGPDGGAAATLALRSSTDPFDAETEAALFARYNYLKHRAARERDRLDKYQPQSGVIDRAETFLRRAAAVRQRIVRANLRLVVSVARKHMAGTTETATSNLADLIGEGNLVLVEAIDTYDSARGARFSTYLTWSLMRRFASVTAKPPKLATIDLSMPPAVPSTEANARLSALEHAETIAATLAQLLSQLKERERYVLVRRYGLTDASGRRFEPQTRSEIGAALGLSAERVRAIEHRALRRLRDVANKLGLTLPATDLFTTA